MRNRYEDYLKGKRVALVGPAPTVRTLSQKEHIDSYDVVVRINKALPVPETLWESCGTKTAVLYNCLDPASQGVLHIPYLSDTIDWLVCPYPPIHPYKGNIDRFKRQNDTRVDFCTFPKDYYCELSKAMNTRPNSGVLAILDILSCNIKELYITGITFFQGGYLKEYRTCSEEETFKTMKAHGNHRQEPQISFLKKTIQDDKRVKSDVFFAEVLKKHEI